MSKKMDFNSLAPPVGRTPAFRALHAPAPISTHSPRAGRTFERGINSSSLADFNSLAPRGANPCAARRFCTDLSFQLTRPARGEPLYLAIGLLAHHYLGRTFTFRLILSSVFFRFFPRTSRDFRVVCGSHDQNMIKPSLSYPAFAPICSTFFFQSFPR